MVIIMLAFVSPNNAQASDITVTGLGDIYNIWKMPNGNIRAIDKDLNIAEFDYVSWKRVYTNSTGNSIQYYDSKTDTYLVGKMYGYFQIAYQIFDPNTFTFTDVPSDGSAFRGYHNGMLIKSTTSGKVITVDYYNTSGVIIDTKTITVDVSSVTVGGVGSINPYTGYMLHSYQNNVSKEYRYSSISFTCENPSAFISQSGGTTAASYSEVLTDGQYMYYAWRDSSSEQRMAKGKKYEISSKTYTQTDVYQGTSVPTFNLPLYASKGYTSLGVLISFSNGAILLNNELYAYTSPIQATTACRDKYNNIIFGGAGGKAIVRNVAGGFVTDSNYYIPYEMGEIKTFAQAAKDAAELARTAAQNAEAKATEAVELIKELDITIAPFIKSVKTTNGATATENSSITVLVSAINATQYRAGVNGIYTTWQSTSQISVPLTVGANTVEVQARRSDDADAPIANDYITVFRL